METLFQHHWNEASFRMHHLARGEMQFPCVFRSVSHRQSKSYLMKWITNPTITAEIKSSVTIIGCCEKTMFCRKMVIIPKYKEYKLGLYDHCATVAFNRFAISAFIRRWSSHLVVSQDGFHRRTRCENRELRIVFVTKHGNFSSIQFVRTFV